MPTFECRCGPAASFYNFSPQQQMVTQMMVLAIYLIDMYVYPVSIEYVYIHSTISQDK